MKLPDDPLDSDLAFEFVSASNLRSILIYKVMCEIFTVADEVLRRLFTEEY